MGQVRLCPSGNWACRCGGGNGSVDFMDLMKKPIYRNAALLALAKHGTQCMRCDKYRPLAMAHSNQLRHGKGRGIKASDHKIAMLCLECHGEMDSGSEMSRAERVEAWQAAHEKTIEWLFESGLVGVIKNE